MSGSQQLPPEPRRPSTKAAERLAVIVDAAERAALSVIDDAEQEARRYLEEAQARADLIVAERLREAADLLERHRGAVAAESLRSARTDPAPAEEEEAEAPAPAPPPVEEEAGAPAPAPVEEAEEPPVPEPPPTPLEAAAVRPAEPELVPEPVAPAAREPATSPQAGSAAARLLATQMAVSGSSRQEIEMRLRNGFEIEDTTEILDAILGPEE
jgi:hypothetical protein